MDKSISDRLTEIERRLTQIEGTRHPALTPTPTEPFQGLQDSTCSKCGVTFEAGKIYGYCCPHIGCPMMCGPTMC